MKKLVLATVSCLALTSSSYAADMILKGPAVEAAQPVSGYIDLYTGWGNNRHKNVSDNNYDGWNLGGAARATYWWARGVSLQLDVQGDGTNYSSNGFNGGRKSEHSYLIGGHWSWRDSRYLWGLFGAAGDATGQDVNFSNASYRHGIIGGEGQAYMGNITLYGQVGYDTTIGDPVGSGIKTTEAVFGRGTVRYYLGSNTRLEGTGLYAGGRQSFTFSGPGQDFSIWFARAKLEHKFASSPFSAYVAYEWSEFRWDTNANFSTVQKFENQKVMAGIRLSIHEGTLQYNDIRGTTLDIIDVGKLFRVSPSNL